MLQSFIIVLREGFESFLLVAVILSYLRKSQQRHLVPAVYWAIMIALALSTGLGYLLFQMQTGNDLVAQYFGPNVAQFLGNESLREGVLGVVAIVMVASLVVYMWRTGPKLKEKMEERLGEVSAKRSSWTAYAGIFLFTALTISREGMETALMLFQVRSPRLIWGALLGLAAAVGMAWGWARLGHLINVRRFFQVTGIFLLLFMIQVAIYSFHEFSEAGLFPNSEAIHAATEKISPDGTYGQWFSLIMVGICGAWLLGAWLVDILRRRNHNHGGLSDARPGMLSS
ncbi:MAG: FTR1 family protein [Acidobacteriota bacterium]